MNIKKSKKIGMFLISVVLVFSLTGCASVSDWFSTTKGTLIGNNYNIYQFDNQGDLTLSITGKSIDIEAYEPEIDSETGEKKLNSVLEITIDGKEIITVGNTLVFEEKGVSKLISHDEIEEINSTSGLRIMPLDKMFNDIKNDIGKARVVVVYSQLGDPISIYEGNNVYVTVPKDLPKMTRINIDGKSLYLHRLNYTIIDKGLLQ